MTSPIIPIKPKLITTPEIAGDPAFGGLRIVRCQSDEVALEHYLKSEYEFQHEAAKRHVIQGVVLALKGAPNHYRIVSSMHPTLREFVDIVKYDPANPPPENWDAIEMREAHDQTQSDFKNAKLKNLGDYKSYNLEALRGERVAYSPAVSGWQSTAVFPDTIFVAFDENNPRALYGTLYLPKKPVMQSDGQTQTAALFATAATGAAIRTGALDDFTVTLEIELNVEKQAAAQSFADRNGRGSQKNKNLVARYDTASPLARLREEAIAGTVFEHRLADGRTTGTTVTATTNIVDLSTMDQMLLGALTGGRFKSENIKHYHVPVLIPYAKDFLELLDKQFSKDWPAVTPVGSDTFRRLYIHGWPFALKGIASAYYDARKDELGPIVEAISATLKDEHGTLADAESAFKKAVAEGKTSTAKVIADGTDTPPAVDRVELESRLSKIDWERRKKHWVALIGAKTDKKTGKPKKYTLRNGVEVVDMKSENTAAAISSVKAKILSPSWTELMSSVDA